MPAQTASELAEAIGQSIGKAIYIQYYNNSAYNSNIMRTVAFNSAKLADGTVIEQPEFKKIKLTAKRKRKIRSRIIRSFHPNPTSQTPSRVHNHWLQLSMNCKKSRPICAASIFSLTLVSYTATTHHTVHTPQSLSPGP